MKLIFSKVIAVAVVMAGLLIILALPLADSYINEWVVPPEYVNMFVDCVNASGLACEDTITCNSNFYYPNESLFLSNLNMDYYSSGIFNLSLNLQNMSNWANITGNYKLKTTCNDTLGNYGTEDNYFTIIYREITEEVTRGSTTSGSPTWNTLKPGVSLTGDSVQQFSEGFWNFMIEKLKAYFIYLLLVLIIFSFLLRATLKKRKIKRLEKIEKKIDENKVLPIMNYDYGV